MSKFFLALQQLHCICIYFFGFLVSTSSTRLRSPGKDWLRVKVGVIQAFPRHPRGLVEDVVVPADAEGKGDQLSSCLDRAGRRPKQAKSQSGRKPPTLKLAALVRKHCDVFSSPCASVLELPHVKGNVHEKILEQKLGHNSVEQTLPISHHRVGANRNM